jgi:hypothetical protein
MENCKKCDATMCYSHVGQYGNSGEWLCCMCSGDFDVEDIMELDDDNIESIIETNVENNNGKILFSKLLSLIKSIKTENNGLNNKNKELSDRITELETNLKNINKNTN